MICENSKICNNTQELTTPLCEECEIDFIEVSERLARDMGAPDCFMCGICGQWYNNPAFFEHPCMKDHVST